MAELETSDQLDVVVFCAVLPEARPLISHWQLNHQSDLQPFAIYKKGRRALVITGIGKAAAAAAVAYSLASLPVQQPVLINLGIAGHPEYALGSLWAAHKITDSDSGRSWYPHMVFNERMPSSALISSGRPVTDYPAQVLYDMEASSFFEIASKFTSQELIHSLKVVSDNRQHAIGKINAQQATTWIQAQLPAIEAFVDQVVAGRYQIPIWDDSVYQQLLMRYHFSVSNAHKLKHLLQIWNISMPEPFRCEVVNVAHANQLLGWLEQQLEARVFEL